MQQYNFWYDKEDSIYERIKYGDIREKISMDKKIL